MNATFSVQSETESIAVQGRHYKLQWSRKSGLLCRISLFDGIRWNEILPAGGFVGHNWVMPAVSCEITEQSESCLKIAAIHETQSWRLVADYEVYPSGYVVCTFSAEALAESNSDESLTLGVGLDERVVFSNQHRVLNADVEADDPRAPRALSVDFSTDERAVTNSVDFLLESVGPDCRKMFETRDGYRFMGWELSPPENRTYSKGFRYENRWALTLSAPDNGPSKVRGQRIYHWYGHQPAYPTDDLLIEMSEYGCSILALHMMIFVNISGGVPIDEKELRRVVDKAHQLGIKVIFYCQPYLISIESPDHAALAECRTEALRWHSHSDTQIVFYEPNSKYDCDELCLRCEKAYEYIFSKTMECWKRFNFDGLYIDWSWPAQGLCSDPSHNHCARLFNFYDYLRLLRDWRKAIGPDQLMIGHGGGFLVSSDFIETYDGCLTGEAQGQLDPVTIGTHFAAAPTIWAIPRRKQDVFHSDVSIEQFIRQGATPHTGLGIMGTGIIATLDPAHHTPLMALWQMWRGFPMEKATFYNHLTEKVIELDSEKIFYSLYVTNDKHLLLILVNTVAILGPIGPAVGVNVKIDIEKLALPEKMNCWAMKGNRYETFRIAKVKDVNEGEIRVPELLLHEFVGFVLSPGEPPRELTDLMEHLEGRPDRLPEIMRARQKGLAEYDKLIARFADLGAGTKKMTYDEFSQGRAAE